MKILFVVMVVVSLLFGLNEKKEFNLTEDRAVKIEVINSSLYVIFGIAFKQKVTDLNRNIVILSKGKEFELFEIEDYNFDGYNDIGVLVDIGLMGVYLYRDYYLYSPKEKRYIKSISNVSNLKIDTKNGELVSSLKSNNSYITSTYKLIDNTPYIAMVRESFMQSGLERVSIFDEVGVMKKSYIIPKYDTIKSKKSYFYITPNGEKTDRYIIKGDKIELLDIDIKNRMIFIEFRGKEVFRRWIKLETIEE